MEIVYHKAETQQSELLTANLRLVKPSDEATINMAKALRGPGAYLLAVVILPELGQFEKPSIINAGQLSAKIFATVIDANGSNRDEARDKVFASLKSLGFPYSGYNDVRLQLSSNSRLILPRYAVFKLDKLQMLQRLVWGNDMVATTEERSLFGYIPRLTLHYLLRKAFAGVYDLAVTKAAPAAAAAVQRMRSTVEVIRWPLIASGFENVTRVNSSPISFMFTKPTGKNGEFWLSTLYDQSSDGSSYEPILVVDRGNLGVTHLIKDKDGRYLRVINSKKYDQGESCYKNQPPYSAIEIRYDEGSVSRVKVLRNTGSHGALEVYEEREGLLPRPACVFFNPLSQIYCDLGFWVGQQVLKDEQLLQYSVEQLL